MTGMMTLIHPNREGNMIETIGSPGTIFPSIPTKYNNFSGSLFS